MRARIDSTKCEGYGMCNEHLPEIFKIDEWGYAYVEGDGEVAADREADALKAIADCPTKAISED
jgi:ferredoxin